MKFIIVFNSGSNVIKELREIYKHHDIVGDEISTYTTVYYKDCLYEEDKKSPHNILKCCL